MGVGGRYTLPIVGYIFFGFFFLRAKKKNPKGQQRQIALGKHSYYFYSEPTEFVGSPWLFFFLSQLWVMYSGRGGSKYFRFACTKTWLTIDSCRRVCGGGGGVVAA